MTIREGFSRRISRSTASLALGLSAWLAIVPSVSGTDWRDSSFDLLMYWADAIVVGEARAIERGRTLNECQVSAATVRVHDVLTGSSGLKAGDSIVVELPGDCDQVLTLDAAVPTTPAIYIVQNKGFEMRRTQPATSADQTRHERAYWRLPAGLPIPYDSGGRVGLFGPGGSFLDDEVGTSFAALAAGVREHGWMAQPAPAETVEPVPLFWIFVWPAAFVALFLGITVVGLGIAVTRRRRWPVQMLTLGLGVVVTVALLLWGTTPVARVLRDVDFASRRGPMQATVDEVRAFELLPGEFGEHASATYVIGQSGQFMVFFFRAAAFSPDPYCGYEYASFPDVLEVDPGGSGGGVAEHLGSGWYWICAA